MKIANTYRYTALNTLGKKSGGLMEGTSREEIEGLLEKSGFLPLRIRNTRFGFPLSVHVYLPEFFSLFSMFLSSGVKMLDALGTLKEHFIKTPLASVLAAIMTELQHGKNLHEAMKRHQALFGPLVCPLVRMGEKSGTLESILQHLSLSAAYQLESREKIQSALRYPLIAFSSVLMLLFVLFAHVLPALESLLLQNQGELYWTTRLLFFIAHHWNRLFLGVVVLLLFCSGSLLFLYFQSTPVKKWCHRKLFKLPIYGPIVRIRLSLHLVSALSLMLSQKVPLSEALKELIAFSPNLDVQERLERILHRVQQGIPLSSAFEESDLFSPVIVRLMKAGEKAGTLPRMFEAALKILQKEQEEKLKKLIAFIEPALLGFVGLLLAWIALSVFFPIYDQLGRIEG